MFQKSLLIGGHVSINGGFHKAVEEAVSIGAQSFAIFTGSQRSWKKKPIDPASAKKFKEECKKHGFPPNSILPHGGYLINLGSSDPEKLQKSRDSFIEEIQRCEQLDISLYNFHPGSSVGGNVKDSLKLISESINLGLSKTKTVIAVLENTAGQGKTLGHSFEQLKEIIDHVQDKDRIGVCIDTCHLFAAGYDIRTKETFLETFENFDKIIGFKYLKGMHLNDSKADLGSKKDRHENIGKGKIGLECFRTLVNDARFRNIPLILETEGPYDKEIELLHSLVEETKEQESQ